MTAISTTVAAPAATQSPAVVRAQTSAPDPAARASAHTAQHSQAPSSPPSPSAIVNLAGSGANKSPLIYGAISPAASSSNHAVPHEHDVLTNALLQVLPDSEGGVDVTQIPGAPVDFIKEL